MIVDAWYLTVQYTEYVGVLNVTNRISVAYSMSESIPYMCSVFG